eukprot:4596894-Prymnesium_polylepis.1
MVLPAAGQRCVRFERLIVGLGWKSEKNSSIANPMVPSAFSMLTSTVSKMYRYAGEADPPLDRNHPRITLLLR